MKAFETEVEIDVSAPKTGSNMWPKKRHNVELPKAQFYRIILG
jgi:hypothetical protein